MTILKTHSFAVESGLTLSYTMIPIEEGFALLEVHHGKELSQFSIPACESYYYLLDDNRVLHLPQSLEATIYEPYEAFMAHKEKKHIAKHIPNNPPFQRSARCKSQTGAGNGYCCTTKFATSGYRMCASRTGK